MPTPSVSELEEMRNVLAESELEYAIMALLEFCEDRGLVIQGDEVEPVLSELQEWIDTDGKISEDDKARLTEFASTIKRIARAAGRAVGAYRRAKRKIGAFKAGVKKAYNTGKSVGARGPRKPMKPKIRPKKPGVPKRPPSGGARPKKRVRRP